MQISIFSFLLLCMSLFVPAAMAEDVVVPDKEHRKGMSYEEYSKYRENMRLHMEKMKPEDASQKTVASGSPSVQTEKSQHGSAYGKGYHSRTPSVDKPAMGAGDRPERPRVERFNRGDMGRR